MKFLWLLLIALFPLSCAHSIHVVHAGDFDRPIGNAEVVQASAEQFVVLGFVGQTDYVNKAYNQLQQECKQGSLQGITTQFSTSLGFFSWTNKILMQGFCVKTG